MALSVAYDHNLSYERRDLERFWGLYRGGLKGFSSNAASGGT